MAYELVDAVQLNNDLLDIADAIRAKSQGQDPLLFPSEFISEIGSIPTGGTTINGATDIPSIIANENIAAGDTCLIITKNRSKWIPPDVMPTANFAFGAWNHAGTRMWLNCEVYDTTELQYKQLFTAGSGSTCAWSPDDSLLVVGSTTSLTIFDTSTTPYTNVTSTYMPSIPGGCYGPAFNPSGTLFAMAMSSSPYIAIFDTTTTPWTQLSNPGILPAGAGKACAFNNDGTLLAVAHNSSPRITIYNTSTWAKLTNPGTLPTGNATCCTFSPNGAYLAVTHASSPYLTVYNTSTWAKLTNPGTLPNGTGNWVAWRPDGDYLMVAVGSSPYVYVYRTTSTPFVKQTNPSNLLGTGASCCAYNPTSDRSAVIATKSSVIFYVEGVGSTPQCYKASNKVYEGAPELSYGYMKTTTAKGGTGQAVLLFDH